MSTRETVSYKRVQGLSRGLAVLRALNRLEGGWASIRELCDATGLHRATVRRLLETLQDEGVVRRSPSDDSYRLTLEVRALSEGFHDDEWISQAATPVLGELLNQVIWPSDLATLDGLSMRIRETTHRFSPLSFHRDMVRRRLPLLSTAAGRAYLAFCPEDERTDLLSRLEAEPGAQPTSAAARASTLKMLTAFRALGHATNIGEWRDEHKTIAIAVPVFHDQRVAACINIVMLKSAITIETARERYLGSLTAAARKIQDYLDAPKS